jgi:hypothetical protein
VIDAKTPLDAYLAALETNDEKTRERQMVDHARQVRNHIRTVASKDYWKALRVTPDFVVMFVPGEAFFAAAIESDPNLFEQAVRQSVLISTPTTLIAFVKARDLREPWHVADGSRAARSPRSRALSQGCCRGHCAITPIPIAANFAGLVAPSLPLSVCSQRR